MTTDYHLTLLAQLQLHAQGFDPGPIDGQWGPRTTRAYEQFKQKNSARSSTTNQNAQANQAPAVGVEFDARSERNLRTLTPEAERKFRAWLRRVRGQGIPAVIICGTRTFAEQAAIYAQGRTNPGKIVSYAPPGSSIHNYGMAIDFVVFEGVNADGGVGQPLWGSPQMEVAGRIAMDMGLDWGGAWKSLRDTPHIQLPGLSIADLRRKMPGGWLPA